MSRQNPMRMWLSDLTIVLPDQVLPRASLLIEDGWITAIREGPSPEPAALNGQGLTLMPGLVDLHGDMLEREVEPRPHTHMPKHIAIFEVDKRMAAAGITTAYAAISFATYAVLDADSTTVKPLRVEEAARALVMAVNDMRPLLLTDLRVHARFEVNYPRAAPVLMELIDQNLIHLVSLMDHTPGQGQYRNIESYIRTMAAWYHVERSVIEQGLDAMLARAQDPTAASSLRRISGLCRQHGITLASHDDDTEGKVALMAEMNSVLSEFPITLEAAKAAHQHNMWVATGAPNALHGKSHVRSASARSLLDAGVLDILISDYYPAAMINAVLSWVSRGLIDLPRAAQLVAGNPAACVGLMDRGEIAVGKRADLTLVRIEPWPRVAATLRHGEVIYQSSLVPFTMGAAHPA